MTSLHDGRRKVVGAADRAAAAQGLSAGMPLAQAMAMIPGLRIADADLKGDADALTDLAVWMMRYSPMAAVCGKDGLWLDSTGCEHLHGGEAAMLSDIGTRLGKAGLTAVCAVAGTPGAAWAVARFGGKRTAVVPDGGIPDALYGMPASALRLPDGAPAALRRMGLTTVGQIEAAPRAPLALRFGEAVLRRLDEATGKVPEPISPVFPKETVSCRIMFIEPLIDAESLKTAVTVLSGSVCASLLAEGIGGRSLELLFERIDGTVQRLKAGTSVPTRNPEHIAKLFHERLDSVDPGPGIEAMNLLVPLADSMPLAAPGRELLDNRRGDADVASLVDRLTNRLGEAKVFRMEHLETDVPERSTRRVPPMSPSGAARRRDGFRRPSRLLSPPQAVEAMSLLPDNPPARFTWRGKMHRVVRADGPERIFAEWWQRGADAPATRDYFSVEDDAGSRFWLFRSGDGVNAATGDLRWFLHGFF